MNDLARQLRETAIKLGLCRRVTTGDSTRVHLTEFLASQCIELLREAALALEEKDCAIDTLFANLIDEE